MGNSAPEGVRPVTIPKSGKLIKCPYCPTLVNAVSSSGKLCTKLNISNTYLISETYWHCWEGHTFTRARHFHDQKGEDNFLEFKVEFKDMKFKLLPKNDWFRDRIKRWCKEYEEDTENEKDTECIC